MAVYSMTGYASAQLSDATSPATDGGSAPAPTVRLAVEIRSVNSRFLDLSFRLPDELRQHEPALRELLQSSLKRGKVELRLALERLQATGVSDPSVKLLQRLNAAQDQVRAWLPSAQPLSVAEVLRMAGSEQHTSTDLSESILPLAQECLKEFVQSRQREGKRLAQSLQERITQLQELAKQAEPLVPQLVQQQRERFLQRWREAMQLTDTEATPEAAQERALSEATAFAIRIDVAEEITRLQSHLSEIAQLLKKGGDIGKRLDFIIQELHREANTLGSKSAALEMSRISVDMKVLIEQMREQVQNIE
ncbi:YicC family protein [Curvibacter sp. CHRR-16]|uniref:YicC/YloC family endoribonuclease n=1 Tax=Curvibacter sp. CHRR-16 TaxID=2835872 RepID=UPI001BD980BE|nr:YicC/YloC family endoribonuclease [Curvibacter sp. CHRR-16]MBT0570901.1 YicC family protein [Curvibacter sp. CHRR-16]